MMELSEGDLDKATVRLVTELKEKVMGEVLGEMVFGGPEPSAGEVYLRHFHQTQQGTHLGSEDRWLTQEVSHLVRRWLEIQQDILSVMPDDSN